MVNVNQKVWQVYLLLIFAPVVLFLATMVTIFILFGFPPANFDNNVLVAHLKFPIMATEWFLVLIVISFLKFKKAEILQLGLHPKKWWLELLIGVVFFFILWGVVNYLIFPFLRIFKLSHGPGSGFDINFSKVGIFISIVTSLTAAFCEEIVWRGYALKYLSKIHHRSIIALFISSIFFGLFHWGYGPSGCLSTAIIGGFLGIIVLWRRNLWSVILIHFLVDFL